MERKTQIHTDKKTNDFLDYSGLWFSDKGFGVSQCKTLDMSLHATKLKRGEPKQIDEFCCSFFEMFKTSKNSLYSILFVAMNTGTHMRNFD